MRLPFNIKLSGRCQIYHNNIRFCCFFSLFLVAAWFVAFSAVKCYYIAVSVNPIICLFLFTGLLHFLQCFTSSGVPFFCRMCVRRKNFPFFIWKENCIASTFVTFVIYFHTWLLCESLTCFVILSWWLFHICSSDVSCCEFQT